MEPTRVGLRPTLEGGQVRPHAAASSFEDSWNLKTDCVLRLPREQIMLTMQNQPDVVKRSHAEPLHVCANLQSSPLLRQVYDGIMRYPETRYGNLALALSSPHTCLQGIHTSERHVFTPVAGRYARLSLRVTSFTRHLNCH